ncbi:TIGR01212 family radical SAM protein [Treponema sp.]|uniref:TIGR01212 family radical SAM protein n=1 Tax=Treponema sp. TaxID=166 RepID=UPI003F0254EB
MKYRTLNSYLREKFGCKVYKLSLSTGCTCPNRDGTKGHGGCTFCSQGGSGDFASQPAPVEIQIEQAKKMVDRKFPRKIQEEERKYIAYFQSYTNTYTGNGITEEKLISIFSDAIKKTEIAALSIGTRPDCISPSMLEKLCALNSIKPVWIELGLQTMHEKTAARINRCYTLKEFEDCFFRLKSSGLEVIVHLILGLPGETKELMKQTVKYVASLNPPANGIKLQLLHILEGTKLAQEYRENPFPLFELDEYCKFICECLEILPSEMVVHRITGDGPKKILIAPLWSADKKTVLNTLKKNIDSFIDNKD